MAEQNHTTTLPTHQPPPGVAHATNEIGAGAPAIPSLTMTIGRLVGDSIKAMREAESAADDELDDHEKGKSEGAYRRHALLKEQVSAHYRRADAAHDLIADLPADSAEEAAVVAVHTLGYMMSISGVEIGGADAGFIRDNLDLAMTGMETVMRFLVKISGLDYASVAGDYFTNIADVDNDPVMAGDLDAELKRLAAAWHAAEDRAGAPGAIDDDIDASPCLEALSNAHSVGLAGLAAKMKVLLRYRGVDETGNLEGDLIRSIARDIDRLAPGSVIYHPETGEAARHDLGPSGGQQ